jgi:zinc protease
MTMQRTAIVTAGVSFSLLFAGCASSDTTHARAREASAPAVESGGEPQSANATDVDIPFTKFVLSNGLTLVVHEDHKAPIVAVNVWYHVGSKN